MSQESTPRRPSSQGARLWSAVRSSVRVASSYSRNSFQSSGFVLQEGRIDDEGIAGDESSFVTGDAITNASPSPDSHRRRGIYVDQWSALGNILAQDAQNTTGRSGSASENTEAIIHDTLNTHHSPSSFISRCEDFPGQPSHTISHEPESMLDPDPENIPRQEDPLAYSNGEGLQLLNQDDDTHYISPPLVDHSGFLRWKSLFVAWQPSLFNKTVFKCVVAYFIASLFTYSPYLSNSLVRLLPNRDLDKEVPISNMHFVATVATYFHPGRSVGSMIEANVYATIGFFYSIVLALASMGAAVFLHDRQAATLSNVVSVVVFVGFGMAFIGYGKVKVGRPTFNTACSLVGVLVFTVIVKEGSSHLGRFSTDKIWQVTLVVAAGVLTSNLVCFLLWPQSACTSLQYDIQRNLYSFSTLLKALTKTFLLDDVHEFNIQSDRLKIAIDNHHSSFVSLKKNLGEAKLESPFDRRIRGRVSSYVTVVDSLNVLAQHLGGLRTSCNLQHEIIVSQRNRAHNEAARSSSSFIKNDSPSWQYFDPSETAFGQYLESVGPHMRSLVFTCSRTLKCLTTAFEATLSDMCSTSGYKKDVQSVETFDILAKDVSTALARFEHEQTVAIKKFYTIFPGDSAAVEEYAADSDSKLDEDVFLIFYFTFLLEEFAKELGKLVVAMEVIRQDESRLQETYLLPLGKRLWAAVFDSRYIRRDRWGRPTAKDAYLQTITQLFIPPSSSFHIPSAARHQPNTSQTPMIQTKRARFNRFIWQIGQKLRSAETKFAIKTGLGCAVLASPAFLHPFRSTFTYYQGQWALISFLVVLSPTVGQSNQMSVHRILGTIVGAIVAVAGYTLFPDDNVGLPIFGAAFSVPCFRYIIGMPQYASTGRFVLLAFNLTALYSYNLRKVGVEVEEIAWKRIVAVVVGVVWATLLNHLVWPSEARREFSLGSSDLLFKLAFLYQKLVLSYSSKRDTPIVTDASDCNVHLEEQPLLGSVRPKQLSEIQSIELTLQVHLIKLEGLLVQTKHEPRLKGPFPVEPYKRFLSSCQHILDLLHTMNQVTSCVDWETEVRRDFILPIDAGGQRRRMVGNVGLFFWLLGSAFHLKTPLPPFLPPAEEARLDVLKTIRQLPVVRKRAMRGSREYLLYFAYALSMKDLIAHLQEIGLIAQELFGTVGGSLDSWEEQFVPVSADNARDT